MKLLVHFVFFYKDMLPSDVTHLHFGSLEFEHKVVVRADRRCPRVG